MLEELVGWVGNAAAAAAVVVVDAAEEIGNSVAGVVGMFVALMAGTSGRDQKAC